MGTPKTQATLPGSIPTGAGGVRPTVQRHYIAERDPTTEYTNPSRCDVTPPRPKINDTVPPGHGVEIDNSTNPFSHLLVPSPHPALSIVPTEGRQSKTWDDKHPIPPCLPTEAKKPPSRLYQAALLLFSACSRAHERQARPLKDGQPGPKNAADIRWDHAANVDPDSRKKTWRLYPTAESGAG